MKLTISPAPTEVNKKSVWKWYVDVDGAVARVENMAAAKTRLKEIVAEALSREESVDALWVDQTKNGWKGKYTLVKGEAMLTQQSIVTGDHPELAARCHALFIPPATRDARSRTLRTVPGGKPTGGPKPTATPPKPRPNAGPKPTATPPKPKPSAVGPKPRPNAGPKPKPRPTAMPPKPSQRPAPAPRVSTPAPAPRPATPRPVVPVKRTNSGHVVPRPASPAPRIPTPAPRVPTPAPRVRTPAPVRMPTPAPAPSVSRARTAPPVAAQGLDMSTLLAQLQSQVAAGVAAL